MSELIKLNDHEFVFDCAFINGTPNDTSAAFVPISYGAFRYIEIVDNMFSPFLDCSFAIDNPLNFTEKQPGPNSFRFSSNNRNLCNINLYPVEFMNSDPTIKQKFTLNLFGVLDESSNIISNNNDSTITMYDLVDTHQAALLEQKVAVYPSIQTNVSVSQNIKNILLKIFPGVQEQAVIEPTFNVGNLGGTQITTNYVFPPHLNLSDAINFLLRYNIATVNGLESQLFLKYNYDTKKFTNYSIYDIFNNAQSPDVNQETFIIGGKDGTANTDLNSMYTTNGASNNIITNTLKDNILHNVSFSNVNFKTSNKELLPVYWIASTDPTNINSLQYIDLVESAKLFETNVLNTNSMKNIYGNNNVIINVDLDPSKISKTNYKFVTTPFNKDVTEKVAKAQLYNSFLFQNMTLSFSSLGQSFRQAGVLINIARAADLDGTQLDKKLLGQWLVTEVRHRIEKGVYTTFMQCVKPFRIK